MSRATMVLANVRGSNLDIQSAGTPVGSISIKQRFRLRNGFAAPNINFHQESTTINSLYFSARLQIYGSIG